MAQQQRWTMEVKVGAFIVSGLALLVGFLFAIGDLSTLFQPGHHLRVIFATANGITSGSPVQYAGVEVGKVERVSMIYPSGAAVPQVELTVRLPNSVQVRGDDRAAISTFGLLGEKFLEITPGPGELPLLGTDDALTGKPPVSTDQIIEQSNEVLQEFKRTLEGLNSVVGDPESRTYIKEAMKEARDATRNWKAFGERLNLALTHTESGQGSLGKLLYDETLYEETVGFIRDLRAHPWKLLAKPKSDKKQ